MTKKCLRIEMAPICTNLSHRQRCVADQTAAGNTLWHMQASKTVAYRASTVTRHTTPGVTRCCTAAHHRLQRWLRSSACRLHPHLTLGQLWSRRAPDPVPELRRDAQRGAHCHVTAATAAEEEGSSTWLFVGLGNPGARYEGTRHNVGFRCLDWIGGANGITIDRKQHNAIVGSGRIGAEKVLLAKPQTFMNVSGKSVRKIMDFYKIRHDHLVVVYDDLDTEPGRVRLRAKGGHGGHNGMRSIIAVLGNSQDFARIRIGIGRPAGRTPVADWVLQDFARSDQELLVDSIKEAEAMCVSILSEGIDRALSGVRV